MTTGEASRGEVILNSPPDDRLTMLLFTRLGVFALAESPTSSSSPPAVSIKPLLINWPPFEASRAKYPKNPPVVVSVPVLLKPPEEGLRVSPVVLPEMVPLEFTARLLMAPEPEILKWVVGVEGRSRLA